MRIGDELERNSELHRVISSLIAKQRRLTSSTNLSRRFQTLWVAAALDTHLTQCTDHEIGELLILVQERFHILEPEFAICQHAIRRLLPRP